MQCETKLLPWYTFHPSCFTFVFRKNRDNIMPLDLHPLSLSGTFIKNYIYAASIKIGLFWVSFVLNCCVFLFVSFSFGEASSFDWNLFRKIREVKERKKIHFFQRKLRVLLSENRKGKQHWDKQARYFEESMELECKLTRIVFKSLSSTHNNFPKIVQYYFFLSHRNL